MSGKVHHDSASGHVSGTAEYVDDRPFVAGELVVDVVYSPVAHGEIQSVDVSEALKVSGIAGIYSARDLHHNIWGSILQDQPFLADRTVQYLGEPILVVAGENREALHLAKKKIKIFIQEMKPLLTIDQAKAQKAFIGPLRTIQRGDVEAGLKGASHRLSGVIKMAGQDHFYLESQASIAYPKEDNQIEVHSSSQHPTEVQHLVAEALGLKFNQVVCVVKRMGGAFGGKESQAAPFAVFASLVAQKLRRPARLILTKDDDMKMTGKRNPFQIHYEVGFDGAGKILALKSDLFSDGGAYADLSTAIMERAMLHSDNAYFIPAVKITGQVCKTHTAPNTAFRGFGGPKGMVLIENIMEDIAKKVGKDAFDIRELNVYRKGQTTPYGQEIEDNILPELFAKIREDSQYDRRREQIVRHNSGPASTYLGMAVTAVKFGISFTTRFLNQGSAIVNVHMDGTVQVSTGATEMGQGVNTKIAVIVAEAFSIPVGDVRVMATSTEKNHNTSATAASSGSDINGQAALQACEQIKVRLSKVAGAVLSRPAELRGRKVAGAGSAPEINIENRPAVHAEFKNGSVIIGGKSISFRDLLQESYLNRVHLGAVGYFSYPGIHYNKETGQGRPFFYYTNGVAVSEVSVDRDLGEVKILRSDILMDLGRPLHRGIDLGQVTGAFVQGLGWLTTENLFYSENGELLTISPSTYKIPSVQDIPRVFNVNLLENPLNSKNLRGSKAVGEPPLMLAISAWAAIKDAISFKRGSEPFDFPVPATQENVLLAMEP